MLTLRAMQSVMPEDWAEQYREYDIEETFEKGEIAVYSGETYRSLRDDNNGHSVTEKSYWEPYNLLNDYLRSLSVTGIKQAVNRFVRDKVIGMETKNLIDNKTLFDGAGRINARIENSGRLVGFEITPIRSGGVVTKLEKVGMQFTGSMGEVKLYLFHSSKREPVWSGTFNYTKDNGTFMWFDLNDIFLPYMTDETNAGGSWYLVYNQNELPAYMEGINFARDWSREPCGTCNQGNLQLYRQMSKFLQLSPFCVDARDWDGKLWDLQDMVYTNTLNYGINLQFSVGCDLTDFIVSHRMEFANVIQLQVAYNALRALALNPDAQVHRVQANADRNEILFQVDGNGEGIKGLHGDLEKAYKALSFDTKGMDELCLTCKNGGIRFGSI